MQLSNYDNLKLIGIDTIAYDNNSPNIDMDKFFDLIKLIEDGINLALVLIPIV